jgi:hypothetical protein
MAIFFPGQVTAWTQGIQAESKYDYRTLFLQFAQRGVQPASIRNIARFCEIISQ